MMAQQVNFLRWRNPIIVALALLLAWCPLAASAVGVGGAPWLAQPYTYYGENRTLTETLQDFGRQFGLKVRIGAVVTGRVNGNLTAETPDRFLDQLASLNAFDWFVDNGALYITPLSARLQRTLQVPPTVISQIRPALQGLGVYSDRYGWGELNGLGQVVVSGPPAYVQRVEQVIANLAATPRNTQIGIYRLRYANVQDRVITYRDKQTIVPGVASIVKRLTGSGVAPVVESTSTTGAMPTPAAPIKSWGGVMPSASIEPDVRLNAVIVKAAPEVQPLYRQLIEQLDVDVPLVQIEVTILDVDNDLAQNLGVDWGLSNIPGAAAAGIVGGPVAAAITTILPRGFNLSAKVHLLETEGRGQIVSKPSLLTMDNAEALLDMNETSFIRTVGERVAEARPVSAGLMFKVTPRVVTTEDNNKRVVLQVDIEDGKRINPTSEELPVLRNSTVSTQAMVNDGESLLIAGNQRNELQKSTSQVPVLGSIPGIGALFRHTRETKYNRTRVFVLTPHVVRPLTASGAAVSEPAFQQSTLLDPVTDLEQLAESIRLSPPSAAIGVANAQPVSGGAVAGAAPAQILNTALPAFSNSAPSGQAVPPSNGFQGAAQ